MRETRQGVIAHHIRTATHNSALTLRALATAVVQHYHAAVPLHARSIDFHTGVGDIYADERANAQILQRMVDGAVRMPVELEESLVLTLPQPFRAEALRELCERFGLLAAPLPSNDRARDHTTAADLMKETGELLVALAPALQDGRIDANDAPHARRALRELRDVQARCASLESQLVAALAGGDGNGAKVTTLRGAA